MAYHYLQPGYTKIIVGRKYSLDSSGLYRNYAYTLKTYNQFTGICKLEFCGSIYFISASKLSHWHMLSE